MELETPLSKEDVLKLKIGDIVYVSGVIYTAGDLAHRKILAEKDKLPFDLDGAVIYHCGPIVRKNERGRGFEIVSA
ncbi:MAG TPA: fumarate hydratase, partial [Thermococcus paralvinellae]|nr:fumarate hydratase [Thermococcus paralvinellae]